MCLKIKYNSISTLKCHIWYFVELRIEKFVRLNVIALLAYIYYKNTYMYLIRTHTYVKYNINRDDIVYFITSQSGCGVFFSTKMWRRKMTSWKIFQLKIGWFWFYGWKRRLRGMFGLWVWGVSVLFLFCSQDLNLDILSSQYYLVFWIKVQ